MIDNLAMHTAHELQQLFNENLNCPNRKALAYPDLKWPFRFCGRKPYFNTAEKSLKHVIWIYPDVSDT